MARSTVAVALAVASLGLLITFQLISQFGLPNLELFHFQHGKEDVTTAPNQISLTTVGLQPAISEDGPNYLLGVGKADITGYALASNYRIGILIIQI